MLAYNYQINFSSVKKWLPQTTQKIIYYLEHLCESQQQETNKEHSSSKYSVATSLVGHKKNKTLLAIDNLEPKSQMESSRSVSPIKNNSHNFDINKTRWELCVKPKNSRGAQQLEKVIGKNAHLEEPDFDEFKKLLEISHLVEIYIKAFFEKIAYRSKSITYLSYKNQHDYAHNKQAAIAEAAKQEVLNNTKNMTPKNIKMEFNPFDIVYSAGEEEKTILSAKAFKFEQIDSLFVIGFHHKDDMEPKNYTLYEINEKEKTLKLKYYVDSKTAAEILAIKDLQSHEIMGRKVKIFTGKISSLQMI